MILVLTGNGKGKTTSAIGTAIRTLGRDKKVLIIQFIKEEQSGEILFLKTLKNRNLKLHLCGKGFYQIKGDHTKKAEHQKAAKNGLEILKKELQSFSPDLTILDEINVACSLGILNPKEIIEITEKHTNTDFILTGRNAPKEFTEIGDLVTEMKEIKHPFQKGIRAKEGLEF
ncbi:MAG: hypothetical protein ACD_65C00215G0005 [uncultured bacterium]|nr:MAG: hypothetical protein ACD_65C00215G0005 [uncultured bacterium]KKT03011.1 MAG: Cob(I)yrinic acid a,c-diamide adenosyltransferase [Candidatus Peregrinibacteria bacterium GW2011_GWF2_43_17]KKT18951.1 MAG: Cob(I)yrinic acid a,c-diamide adenosyltransferase [Candidatus Peregrinibacteria bacterium GW2011_GWA2_43_8]HAU40355.1 cob(I)yrinic acid a,c-diamide adenosyltransferase [Candidatus Peregrinibacteria bacterium]